MAMMKAVVLGAWLSLVGYAHGFGIFDSFKASLNQRDGMVVSKREELKEQLMLTCRRNGERREVEEIVENLKMVSPTPDSATSPLLQKDWLLEWTTEKEINFFIEWNISGDITQLIDEGLLVNCIQFKKGGYLGVTGALTTDGGLRTNFEFTEATLDLGRFGSFNVPPIGKGWFDTVYLDEELRVDTNSRNDILICRPVGTTNK